MKTPTIKPEIRDVVASALAFQAKAKLPRKWNQEIADLAVGLAAVELASAGDFTALTFAELYGHDGFLSNCSQFAQVLARLDVTDAIYVKRESTSRSALAAYMKEQGEE